MRAAPALAAAVLAVLAVPLTPAIVDTEIASVETVDVGQGDGIVIHTPSATTLVDTGPTGDEIVDHLEAEGVERLRAFVVTHPDADHAGGCEQIFDSFNVTAFYHPGAPKGTQTWQRCLDAAQGTQAPVLAGSLPDRTFTDEDLDPGDHIPLGATVTAQVLHIGGNWADVNDQSIVLRLDAGQTNAILTGDVTCDSSNVEEAMLARAGSPLKPTYTLDADLLKVGHHGSSTSTCQPWLDATTPEVATIGVGADNPFGHPSPSVIERVCQQDAEVFRTDLDGTITWSTTGTSWTTTPEQPAQRCA